MALFTDEEKVRIRYHAGYTNAAKVATAVLGSPSSIETMFIIETAMESLRPEATYQVRRVLDVLDTIESQMVDDMELLALTNMDEIGIRQDEQEKLTDRYLYWRDSLCNLLGIIPNPYDKRFMAGGGINVRVSN